MAKMHIHVSVDNLEKSIKFYNSLFGSKAGLAIYYPSKNFCTDNGAMIAYAGYLKYAANQLCDLEGEVRARWPLSET